MRSPIVVLRQRSSRSAVCVDAVDAEPLRRTPLGVRQLLGWSVSQGDPGPWTDVKAAGLLRLSTMAAITNLQLHDGKKKRLTMTIELTATDTD